ncbi:hypothetical protein BKA70DRAFT_171776 [Coprinopsis sp. MPI-PUGE-AT-0042]|nr:hypothetical protein BKA70DRAFT_171776 [Coprinopsis sp. MPI-PUGE-AT-0042]
MVLWAKEILTRLTFHWPFSSRVETPPFPDSTYALGTIQVPYRGYDMSLHDGALPGSNSFFARIRNESIGVFTLATDDLCGSLVRDRPTPCFLMTFLVYHPRSRDHARKYRGKRCLLQGLPGKTPRPVSPRPAPEIESLVGSTFAAPGYAPFTVASVNLSDPQAVRSLPTSHRILRTEITTLEGLESLKVRFCNAAWNQNRCFIPRLQPL